MGRILVVDDEPAVLELMRRALMDASHEVETALDGQAALATLLDVELGQVLPYDLVVTDLVMAGVGGLELISRVRSERPRQAFVVVTGFGELAHGAHLPRGIPVVPKPFDPSALIHAVDSALRRAAS